MDRSLPEADDSETDASHIESSAEKGDGAEQASSFEPPIWSARPEPVATRTQWRLPPQPEVETETYGVPRVFDVFTMMAVTLAFAVMFALLRLLQPALSFDLDLTAICLGGYVTGIGLAQLALWHGRSPRAASMVAGPFLWLLVFIGLGWSNTARFDALVVVSGGCSAVLGIPAGYLSGAIVAGVFLVADVFRRRLMPRRADHQRASDASIFADEETDP